MKIAGQRSREYIVVLPICWTRSPRYASNTIFFKHDLLENNDKTKNNNILTNYNDKLNDLLENIIKAKY